MMIRRHIEYNITWLRLCSVFAMSYSKDRMLRLHAIPLRVWSEANQVDISSIVIHPNPSSTEPHSVVYLLHGAGGSYTYWSDEMDNLDVLSSTNGVIIVLIDAQGTWYFDSPVNTSLRMETYVTQELLPISIVHTTRIQWLKVGRSWD